MKKTLDQCSIEELKEEIRQREIQNSAPTALKSPDMSDVVIMAKEYIETLKRGEGVDDDFEHYLFECVMESVYGEIVWTWVNAQSE